MEKTNVAANKELVKKFFQNFEEGRRDEVEKLWGPNYRLNFPGSPQPLSKTEAKQKMKEYNTAFPDLRFTIQSQYVDGDTVITRSIGRATHKGEFNGIAPTNKKISATNISIHRIENNKIVEETVEFDALGLIQQLCAFSETTRGIAEKALSSVH